MQDIGTVIVDRLNLLSKIIKHDKICFSGVESIYRDKKDGNWKKTILLSIVLAEHRLEKMDSDLEMISELVIELVLLNEDNLMSITMDFYYGNGILIQEEIVLKEVDITNVDDELINEIEALFFNSIESKIYLALDAIIPANDGL